MSNIELLQDFLRNTAVKYDPDPSHAEQVAKLSLQLFDHLKEIHKLNSRDRLILEIAAWLHDIGWSRSKGTGHHKHSFEMILEMEIPGLESHERIIGALVARFHRKALPDASKHKTFATLNEDFRSRVEWLAGILRVADGLDRSHSCMIESIGCEVLPQKILLKLVSPRSCKVERWGADQKKNLLETKSNRLLDFQ